MAARWVSIYLGYCTVRNVKPLPIRNDIMLAFGAHISSDDAVLEGLLDYPATAAMHKSADLFIRGWSSRSGLATPVRDEAITLLIKGNKRRQRTRQPCLPLAHEHVRDLSTAIPEPFYAAAQTRVGLLLEYYYGIEPRHTEGIQWEALISLGQHHTRTHLATNTPRPAHSNVRVLTDPDNLLSLEQAVLDLDHLNTIRACDRARPLGNTRHLDWHNTTLSKSPATPDMDPLYLLWQRLAITDRHYVTHLRDRTAVTLAHALGLQHQHLTQIALGTNADWQLTPTPTLTINTHAISTTPRTDSVYAILAPLPDAYVCAATSAGTWLQLRGTHPGPLIPSLPDGTQLSKFPPLGPAWADMPAIKLHSWSNALSRLSERANIGQGTAKLTDLSCRRGLLLELGRNGYSTQEACQRAGYGNPDTVREYVVLGRKIRAGTEGLPT